MLRKLPLAAALSVSALTALAPGMAAAYPYERGYTNVSIYAGPSYDRRDWRNDRWDRDRWEHRRWEQRQRWWRHHDRDHDRDRDWDRHW